MISQTYLRRSQKVTAYFREKPQGFIRRAKRRAFIDTSFEKCLNRQHKRSHETVFHSDNGGLASVFGGKPGFGNGARTAVLRIPSISPRHGA